MLKIRRVSGVPCVSLRHADLGSFAVPQEWTDWGAPVPVGMSLLIDAFGLSELAVIVDFLNEDSTRD